MRNNSGLKSKKALRKELADVAEAHNADGFAEDFDALKGGALPLTLAQRLICCRNLARGGQKQGDGLLTGGVNIGRRGINHHDSAFGGCRDVNIIQAHAGAPNNLQLLPCGQHLGVDSRGRTNKEGVSLRNCRKQFLTVRAIHPANLNAVSQSGYGGFCKLIGDKYDRLRHNFLH